jgi:hypothetical protein
MDRFFRESRNTDERVARDRQNGHRLVVIVSYWRWTTSKCGGIQTITL